MTHDRKPLNTNRITRRPWQGRDVTTGFTMEQFDECMRGVDVPDNIARAAISICRSYGIQGIADPGYIANTIKAALAEEDDNG